jgi:hypothetical protein
MSNIAYDPLYSLAKGTAEGSVKGIFEGITDLLEYFSQRKKESLIFPRKAFFVNPLDNKLNWRGKALPLGMWYYNPVAEAEVGGSRDKFRNLLVALTKEAETIKVLTVSGYPWASTDGLIYSAVGETEKNKSKKFLIVNPQDPRGQAILSKRETAGRVTKGFYLNEAKMAIERARELRRNGHDIQLAYYTDYPFWRLFIFNSKLVFTQTYPVDKKGDETPVFGFHNFDKEQVSLADYFVYLFDVIFERAVKETLA